MVLCFFTVEYDGLSGHDIGFFTLASPLPFGIFLFKNGMIDMVSRFFFPGDCGLVFFGICEENDTLISDRRKWTGVWFDDAPSNEVTRGCEYLEKTVRNIQRPSNQHLTQTWEILPPSRLVSSLSSSSPSHPKSHSPNWVELGSVRQPVKVPAAVKINSVKVLTCN